MTACLSQDERRPRRGAPGVFPWRRAALFGRRALALAREMETVRRPRGGGQGSTERAAASPGGKAIAAPRGRVFGGQAAGRKGPAEVVGRDLEYVAQEDLAIRRANIAVAPPAWRVSGETRLATTHDREVDPRSVRGTCAGVGRPVAATHGSAALVARRRLRTARTGPFAFAAEPRRKRAVLVRRAPGVVTASAAVHVGARRRRDAGVLPRRGVRIAPAGRRSDEGRMHRHGERAHDWAHSASA
jgi:hypothetical protein